MTHDASAHTGQDLAALLAASPGLILEELAETHGVSVRTVVEHLPVGCVRWIDGRHMVEVFETVATWGPVQFIVTTADFVLECQGPLPSGKAGRRTYDLHGGSPLGGHFRPERCAAIVAVERPFMGKDTYSLWFFNTEGAAMFKIFAGRNEARMVHAHQIDGLHRLAERLGTAG